VLILKNILIIYLLWIIPINSSSQDYQVIRSSAEQLDGWFYPEKSNLPTITDYLENLDRFVDELSSKRHRYKNEIQFLEYVYYKVHRKYLRNYSTPSTLLDLIEKKQYDCLTGTALYALIFERLGIDYSIVETTYHIYLTIQDDEKLVVVESTNPIDGFIFNPELVREAIEKYRQGPSSSTWNNQDYYPSQEVNNQVTFKQLAGLQYYNQAVKYYNQQNLMPAIKDMAKALDFYPSSRLKEMMVVMLNTLEHEDVDPLFKQEYLLKFGSLRNSIIIAYQKK